MKSIVIIKPGEVVIKNDIPMPKPQKGEALLKLLCGGICGSDLGSYRGVQAYFSYPRTPGHEFSAEIVEINEQSSEFKKGMVVTANPYFNCGHCYSCNHGLVNACMSNQTMGVQREGAFSEYITLPISRLIDGKGLEPDVLAAIEPFCIGYHGIKRGNVHKGDKVLVVGAGTIGIMAAFSAKHFGAETFLSDVAPEKLAYARETLGFKGTILNSSQGAFDEQVKEITDGNGFDVTVEAVGLPSTFLDCINAACFGGRMIQIGVSKKNADFNFRLLQQKELNVYGSRNALTGDFKELIDIVKSGEIPLRKVITNTYPFEQAPQAFKDFSENQGKMLKVELDFTR